MLYMTLRLAVGLLAACSLSAQTPNLTGVWKANLEKSKLNGPAPTNYLVILDQQGSKLSETVGIFSQRGETRMAFTYNTDAKPSFNSYQGFPMRTQASWDGGALVLESKVAGQRLQTVTEKYALSSDGSTLTVDTATKSGERETHQLLVLEKQPDAAGEPLRKPEQTAAERFKNIQVMKNIPGSQLLFAMRYFTMALGVNCEHCHVQGQFQSDDKPAKAMARKMIVMNHSINDQTFNGKMEVQCYTCHRGQAEPQSSPAFE
jgi:hypothetical protein